MKQDITFWRGNNLGPQRKEFMKNNLRLEPIEITEEEIKKIAHETIWDIIRPEVINEEHDDRPFKIAKAILSKLKGESKEEEK